MDEKLFRCRVSTCDTCWNGCQTRTATFPVEDWTSLYCYTTLTSSVFLYTDGVHQRVEGGGGGSWWCATCAGKLCAPKSLISLWFLFLILVVWKPINPTFWKKFYTSIDLPFGQNGQKASNNNYMTNESGVANRVQVSISSFFWQLFLP